MLLRAVVQRARGASLRAARPVAVSNASRQFSLALTQKPQQPALGRFARLLSVEDVPVPSMGDSITEGTVVEWTAQVGDGVAVDDVVVVIETDKVSVEVRSPIAGAVTALLSEIDDVVEVGADLFSIDTDAAGAAKAPAKKAAAAPEKKAAAEKAAPGKPAPAAKPAPAKAPPKAPAAAPAAVSNPPPSMSRGSRSERRVKMNRMRNRIAERLKDSQNTAAALTTFQETDMGNLMELRTAYKEEFERIHGVKLGFMSAFVAAATSALQEIPAVNAYIDDAAKEIVYRDYCDVSVAARVPRRSERVASTSRLRRGLSG